MMNETVLVVVEARIRHCLRENGREVRRLRSSQEFEVENDQKQGSCVGKLFACQPSPRSRINFEKD